MHCYYAFLLHGMLLSTEIFVILFFTNFKLVMCQYCDLFTSHCFFELFKSCQGVHISYLSIHADR